jgi:hypothetical protein
MYSVEDRNMRFDPAPHQPTIEGLDVNRNFSLTAGIVARFQSVGFTGAKGTSRLTNSELVSFA